MKGPNDAPAREAAGGETSGASEYCVAGARRARPQAAPLCATKSRQNEIDVGSLESKKCYILSWITLRCKVRLPSPLKHSRSHEYVTLTFGSGKNNLRAATTSRINSKLFISVRAGSKRNTFLPDIESFSCWCEKKISPPEISRAFPPVIMSPELKASITTGGHALLSYLGAYYSIKFCKVKVVCFACFGTMT
ncbi:hypothetical protein EVAR_32430_1 [Eumeta japonica]|uniref:Uncharacterized protein n=1 Tax=Eumeta variegata TaxID=151549 RepID=A0A4C1VK62_EUMVA|nr:hypothetical protein EVAR_32430_1 [Eumeta japonica]